MTHEGSKRVVFFVASNLHGFVKLFTNGKIGILRVAILANQSLYGHLITCSIFDYVLCCVHFGVIFFFFFSYSLTFVFRKWCRVSYFLLFCFMFVFSTSLTL